MRKLILLTVLSLLIVPTASSANSKWKVTEYRAVKHKNIPPHARPSKVEMIAFAEQMEIKYGLDKWLVRGICHRESRWDTDALGADGEIGVCQLMPVTVTSMLCKNCYGLPREIFRIGSHGDLVKKIQTLLARENLYNAALDGRFGKGMEEAVMKYQSLHNLADDGVIGPSTWSVMFPDTPFPGTTIQEALWDPFTNIEYCAKYLALIRDTWSDNPLVMSAIYNAGAGNIVNQYSLGIQRYIDTKTEEEEKAALKAQEEARKEAEKQVKQLVPVTSIDPGYVPPALIQNYETP